MNVTRLTDQQVAEAQQSVCRSPRKHDSESKQGQVESMDITPQSDAKKDSEEPKKLSKDKGQRDQSSERKEKRDRSGSLTRKELKKKEDGRPTAPAPATKTGRTESQPTTSKGPTNLTSTLAEAGGVRPPGDKVGVIPRHPDGRGRRPVDYNTEPFPVPQYQVAPPAGSHLAKLPVAPKAEWQRDTEMSSQAVLEHIQGIANASRRQEQYLTHLDFLRQRADMLAVLDNAHDDQQRRAERPAFIDEGHSGALIASTEATQLKLKFYKSSLKDEQKETVRLLKENTELTDVIRQKGNDIVALKGKVEEQKRELQTLRIERDTALQARAQVLGQDAPLPAHPAPAESTETLQRELQAAKIEINRLKALGADPTQVTRCATLERELAQAHREITVLEATAPDTATQEKLANLSRERDESLACEQKLLAERKDLEVQYNEIQHQRQQASLTVTDLESRPRVAQSELKATQDHLQHEVDYGKRQGREVDRLGQELEESKAKVKRLKDKKDALKAAASTSAASRGFPSPAQGTGVPLGQQYASPGPSSMAPLGQPSAAAIQYRMAGGVTASPGQVGHIPSYMYPASGVTKPVYASPQQMGGLAQMLGSSPMQMGPPPGQGMEPQGTTLSCHYHGDDNELLGVSILRASVSPGGASRPGAH